MKKFFFMVVGVLALVGWITPWGIVHAEEKNNLNTGVLSNVWHSPLEITAGEKIYLYGGIQNHSGLEFSGNAVFFIDGKEVSTSRFVSKPDSLIELSSTWKALAGEHKVQIKIDTLKPISATASTTISLSSILSSQSEEHVVSVKEVKTPITVDKVKDNATEVAIKVVNAIDKVTNDLATNLQTYKTSTTTKSNNASGGSGVSDVSGGQVLGTSTKNVSPSTASMTKATSTTPIGTSIFNTALDILSSLLVHWKYTLGAMAVLFLIFRFTRSRDN